MIKSPNLCRFKLQNFKFSKFNQVEIPNFLRQFFSRSFPQKSSSKLLYSRLELMIASSGQLKFNSFYALPSIGVQHDKILPGFLLAVFPSFGWLDYCNILEALTKEVKATFKFLREECGAASVFRSGCHSSVIIAIGDHDRSSFIWRKV